jgi:hypothetical protein
MGNSNRTSGVTAPEVYRLIPTPPGSWDHDLCTAVSHLNQRNVKENNPELTKSSTPLPIRFSKFLDPTAYDHFQPASTEIEINSKNMHLISKMIIDNYQGLKLPLSMLHSIFVKPDQLDDKTIIYKDRAHHAVYRIYVSDCGIPYYMELLSGPIFFPDYNPNGYSFVPFDY